MADPPSQPNIILVIPKRSYLESRNGTTLLIYLALINYQPSTKYYALFVEDPPSYWEDVRRLVGRINYYLTALKKLYHI